MLPEGVVKFVSMAAPAGKPTTARSTAPSSGSTAPASSPPPARLIKCQAPTARRR
jgi:hypothetical protein